MNVHFKVVLVSTRARYSWACDANGGLTRGPTAKLTVDALRRRVEVGELGGLVHSESNFV